MNETLLLTILVGAVVGAVSGYIGSIMVLKRMALVGDALTHVALPGMAIALAINANPLVGAFITLTLVIVGIWYLEKSSGTYPEALVGVFFTASLALGVLLTDELELLEALFGSLENTTTVSGLITISLSLLVFLTIKRISKGLIISTISPEIAQTTGINVARTNLIYMLMVGLIVSLGIKFVGTLLMGALVIIPAVAARNITRSMNEYFLMSATFGAISAIVGISVSALVELPVGAMVVLISVVFYVSSYILKRALKIS